MSYRSQVWEHGGWSVGATFSVNCVDRHVELCEIVNPRDMLRGGIVHKRQYNVFGFCLNVTKM